MSEINEYSNVNAHADIEKIRAITDSIAEDKELANTGT